MHLKENSWQQVSHRWPYTSLGAIQNGRVSETFARFLARNLPKIRASALSRGVVYAFGLDLLLLAWLASRGTRHRTIIIYEVADIVPTLIGTGVMRLLRRLERFLVQRLDLMVVTSEAYITGYYAGYLGLIGIPHIVIDNKIDTKTMRGLRWGRCQTARECAAHRVFRHLALPALLGRLAADRGKRRGQIQGLCARRGSWNWRPEIAIRIFLSWSMAGRIVLRRTCLNCMGRSIWYGLRTNTA